MDETSFDPDILAYWLRRTLQSDPSATTSAAERWERLLLRIQAQAPPCQRAPQARVAINAHTLQRSVLLSRCWLTLPAPLI